LDKDRREDPFYNIKDREIRVTIDHK